MKISSHVLIKITTTDPAKLRQTSRKRSFRNAFSVEVIILFKI